MNMIGIFLLLCCLIGANYAKFEPQVAFKCGRPTLIMRENGWNTDFAQDCIENPAEIVAYCQRSYPNLKIDNAEPSITETIIQNWCDFSSANCDFHASINTFKCLDPNFQSDALTLPKDCKFGHLTDTTQCRDHRERRHSAEEQCHIQGRRLDSVGMTFPCHGKPMQFLGVEFVCCPTTAGKTQSGKHPKPVEERTKVALNNFVGNNPVMNSERSEQKNFQQEERTLVKSEENRLHRIVEQFHKAKALMQKLLVSDPNSAKTKLKKIEKAFQRKYSAMVQQFLDNKEQLMNFHSDRVRFIFTSGLEYLRTLLDSAVKNNQHDKVLNILRKTLDTMHTRRRDLIRELAHAKKLGISESTMADLQQQLAAIPIELGSLLRGLDKNPSMKETVMKEIEKYDPRIRGDHLKIYAALKEKFKSVKEVLAGREHDDGPIDGQVHYDLGLHDKDQWGHHSGHEGLRVQEHHHNRRTIGRRGWWSLSLILGLATAVVVVLVGVLILMLMRRRRQGSPSGRSHLRGGYRPTAAASDAGANQDIPRGFGVSDTSCANIIKSGGFNMYENPNFGGDEETNEMPAGVHQSSTIKPLIGE